MGTPPIDGVPMAEVSSRVFSNECERKRTTQSFLSGTTRTKNFQRFLHVATTTFNNHPPFASTT
jgi:hypothetical protein